MYERALTGAIVRALADTPVVFLSGPRQAGKSTLVRQIAGKAHPADYVTLDEPSVLALARRDPTGFIASRSGPVVIDEAQRAPDLFLAIKASVDDDRRPGRFLLTGSADPLLIPRIADALVGRVEILRLLPLSQGEIEGVTERFVDSCFGGKLPEPSGGLDRDVWQRVVRGGFPEAVARAPARRAAWFRSYLETIVTREAGELAGIERREDLPRLLSLLAARSGSLMNLAELSRSSGVPRTTLERHLALLRAMFVFDPLPAWSANLGKRLTRAPKVMLADSGLACAAAGLSDKRLESDPTIAGHLLESFVVAELRKQVVVSRTQPRAYHFRAHSGQEVDVVLEEPGGMVVAIEVKASATISERDIAGIRFLSDALGERLARGVLLYSGTTVVPFGKRLIATPVRTLWSGRRSGSKA